MRQFICIIDAPGTRFEDLPVTWSCPDCGAGKEDFEPLIAAIA